MSAYNQQAINLIAAELTSRGVKPEVAAGAIAGLMGESGAGLNPLSFNDQDPGGGSGGIGQWNRDRLVGGTGLLAFAKAHGVDVDTNTPTDSKKVPLDIQVKFLGHELDTKYSGFLKGLQSVTTGEEGLTTWVNNYENPADKAGAIAQRRQYIQPVTGMIGGKVAPASTDTAATGLTPNYAPPSPMEVAGLSLGQALGNMSASVGGGSQIVDPPDPPAIRTPALDENFMPSSNPVPAQFAGGVGSQLGSLALQQPQTQPLEDPSITQGAPSMTAMLSPVGGGGAQNVYDPRRPPSTSPFPNSLRFSRLG